MNIEKYTSDFHDGELMNIEHQKNKIELSLSSAEVDPEEVLDLSLASHDRIRGKLHLEEIKNIKLNGELFLGKLIMQHESAEILHLGIKSNHVEMEILWRDSDFQDKGYSEIAIETEKIYWENIPDLREK